LLAFIGIIRAKSAAADTLPDEPELLKQITAQQAKRIALLEEVVYLQQHKRFGASSEKSLDQQEMFNEAELTQAAEQVLAEPASDATPPSPDTVPAATKRPQALTH
jgi:transposase